MLETGTVLQGRFLIEQELARGGMGAVYLATDQKFGSRVAIKERFYEHRELAEAFEREARILNSLHHPILPHVSDYFSEGGGHFLVMEYIEGDDLSEVLKRDGAFPIADVVRWMNELLDGLDYLHSQEPPIIHRDIKPGNLKLTSRGNIVLLDFGLAKETTGNTQGLRSVFGYSRRYSPLEQIEGAGTDARSDLFSLGATLFHLLTGQPPIDVLARASAIVAGRRDPLQIASEVNPEVPLAMAEIVHRALALNPDQRFASASEMRSVFESAEHAPEPEEITQVAAAPVATFPALEAFAEDISDEPNDDLSKAVPPASNAAATRTEKRASVLPKRPFLQRPAFWASMVVLALIVIGFSQLRLYDSRQLTEAPMEQATSTPAPAAEPTAEAPEVATSKPEPVVETKPVDKNLGNQTVDGPADQHEDVQKETARNSEPRSTKEKRIDRTADDPKSKSRAYEVDPPIIETRAAPMTRRERREEIQQARRKRPRFVDADAPPVSSIEMILTGVPPERRRHRRWQPPY